MNKSIRRFFCCVYCGRVFYSTEKLDILAQRNNLKIGEARHLEKSPFYEDECWSSDCIEAREYL